MFTLGWLHLYGYRWYFFYPNTKNTEGSLSFLGLSFAFGPIVNFVHPYSTLEDLTQIIIFTIVISGWLIIYDLKKNITSHLNGNT